MHCLYPLIRLMESATNLVLETLGELAAVYRNLGASEMESVFPDRRAEVDIHSETLQTHWLRLRRGHLLYGPAMSACYGQSS